MLGKVKPSLDIDSILKIVSEAEIAQYYLNINKIPILINSPFRVDNHPSFLVGSIDGKKVTYKDFSTGECGGIFDIIMKLYNISLSEALYKIYNDLCKFKRNIKINKITPIRISSKNKSSTKIDVVVRDWKSWDINYWKSYGISKEWLNYAEVYPIKTIIISKEDKNYIRGVDKYAYVYIERKEGTISKKIYQPFSKNFKWLNTNNSSVIGLWTKIPPKGDVLCICSSLKDSLCLWSNLNIPCIYLQGEGYKMSNTAINELKKRYKKVYIMFDNDEPGKKDSIKLSKETGFINIVLPNIDNKKDISDLYKHVGRNNFIDIIKPLFFPNIIIENMDNVPF